MQALININALNRVSLRGVKRRSNLLFYRIKIATLPLVARNDNITALNAFALVKSLLSSLCQREGMYPSLAKGGVGRFLINDALLVYSLVTALLKHIIHTIVVERTQAPVDSKQWIVSSKYQKEGYEAIFIGFN